MMKRRESMVAYGPDLLGDSVNLENGELSFSATDISLPGNSVLPVEFRRSYTARNRKGHSSDAALADWTLDIPHISAIMPVDPMQPGVTVLWRNLRCSNLQESRPQTVYGWIPAGGGVQEQVPFTADDVWAGINAAMPHGGPLLRWPPAGRTLPPAPAMPGRNFTWTTGSRAFFSCLSSIQNAPGEGFLAVTPDGTQYRFDRMASYLEPSLAGPPQMSPDRIQRVRVVLYATEVKDRFNNWVKYHFSPAPHNAPNAKARLDRIEASDGRNLYLTWSSPSGGVVTSVSNGQRTWFYGYAQTPRGDWTLRTVTQPDLSQWTIEFDGLTDAHIETHPGDGSTCESLPPWVGNTSASGSITHPTGARGEFVVNWATFGRTHAPGGCTSVFQFHAVAARSKKLIIPGFADREWGYAFSSEVSSFKCGINGVSCDLPQCTSDSCALGGIRATVFEPDGKAVRHSFGNAWRYNEGKLLKVEVGTGNWPGDDFVSNRTTTFRYQFSLTGQQFATRLGESVAPRGDQFPAQHPRPTRSVAIVQDGSTFGWGVDQSCVSWNVDCFDSYARPTQLTETSGLGYSRTIRREYHDHSSLWVLGQPAATWVNGTLAEQVNYDGRAQPQQEFQFGQLTGTMSYHPDGRLHVFTDARSHQTFLEHWYRGIPQLMRFPSGFQQSAVVNDRGWITAVTDENGFTTSYQHDVMGRLEQITYPAGDTVAWTPVNFTLTKSNSWNHGLAPGHWVWARQQGNQRVNTYLDALWRPLIEERFDAGNVAGTQSQTVKRYDTAGRLSFVSRPQRGLSSGYWGDYPGTTTEYDALDRVRRTTQSSELGPLVTKVDWLSGFRQQVTNPRNFVSTTSYQAFATPTTDNPVSIAEQLTSGPSPTWLTTTITRDAYGKPLTMSRTDLTYGGTLTRQFVYDTEQRLCKEIHPESGASIYWYDEAGNRTHSLTGSWMTTAACDRAWAPQGEATRTDFDPMNRPIFVDVPGAGADTTTVYTPDGLVQRTETALPASRFERKYEYNRRRLVTAELQDHWQLWSGTWFRVPMDHRWYYDALGHVTWSKSPNNTWIDYAPNALGQPTLAGMFASNALYGPDGQLASFTYGNGIHRTVARNTRGLPQRVTDQRFGVAVFDEQYSWDANGNLESQTDWLNTTAGTRWLGYDGRDRLTSSWISGYGNESFGWDAFDRLRWRNTWNGAETFNYDSTHRLTSINGPSGTRWYGQDARGNVTGRPGFTHIYDAANRLTETPGVGRFEYDGHGRRTVTWRADGTAKVDFYTVDGKVRYKSDNREGGGTDYVYLGDQLVAEHKGPWRSSRGTIYTHTDHLGTPVVRTNNLAHIYSRDRRTNFGAPLTLNPVEAEAGYTGHVEDPDQGLVYMQQRYYDPAIARFLSVDPVGPLADPTNHFGRYHYALNNPYRYTDPDGRQATCTGTRIQTSNCDAFAGNQRELRDPANFTSSGSFSGGEARATTRGEQIRNAANNYIEDQAALGEGGKELAQLLAADTIDGVASLADGEFGDAGGSFAMAFAGRKISAAGEAVWKGAKISNELANALGMDRRSLGKAVEKIKAAWGMRGDHNVVIGRSSGDVYDSKTGELLGNVRQESGD